MPSGYREKWASHRRMVNTGVLSSLHSGWLSVLCDLHVRSLAQLVYWVVRLHYIRNL